MLRWAVAVSLLLGCALIALQEVQGCNEAVCGSIVSKCLLTQSCNCDLQNCTCCKECFSCLNSLFSECCACLDMCPTPNETGSLLWKKSNVEDFTDGEQHPNLFRSLTEAPDPQDRWTSITYAIDIDPLILPTRKEKLHLQSKDQKWDPINCTVAFMSTCMSWEKCKMNCRSMGSASYRWFHDGCCECIGNKCLNYGINESKCLKCPSLDDDEDLEDFPDDEMDYGENEELEDD